MDFEVLASGLGFVEGPVGLSDGDVVVASITEGALVPARPRRVRPGPHRHGRGPQRARPRRAGSAVRGPERRDLGWPARLPGGDRSASRGVVEQLVAGGLETPNDLCFGPDGRLYFTDPRGESSPPDPSTAKPGRLCACDRDGGGLELLLEGPRFINGLAFTPAADALYVVETSAPHQVLRAPGRPPGSATSRSSTSWQAGFPDGIAVDADGQLWVAATFDDSIHVVSPEGRLLRKLACGEGALPTNCCFGGPERGTLYVAASGAGSVLRTDVDARGVALFTGLD